jgi:tetratricopeptide (TPR) repeat protein
VIYGQCTAHATIRGRFSGGRSAAAGRIRKLRGSGLAFFTISYDRNGVGRERTGLYLGLVMRIKLGFVLLLLLGAAWPAHAADRRDEAKSQVEFGISVAQRGLWKEAAYRWEKAVELDPSYGAAWNNLGIGYEQLGRFDDARKAYEKALEVEPDNTYIRNNYDLFREIYDRQNRRRDR